MYMNLVPAVTLSDDMKLGNNEKTASRDQGDSDWQCDRVRGSGDRTHFGLLLGQVLLQPELHSVV